MINGEIFTYLPEVLIATPILMAFTGAVRDEIIGRAGNRSEISGVKPKNGALHAMHLNHTKDETYNTAERGIAATPKEHLIYHAVHRGRAENIGLTEEENESAINLLYWIIKKLGE